MARPVGRPCTKWPNDIRWSIELRSRAQRAGALCEPGARHKDEVGTRHVFVAVCILADPADTRGPAQVHALQDALKVERQSVGRFEASNWDWLTDEDP